VEPAAALFADFNDGISATHERLLPPTADELRDPLPRVKIVGEMFGKKK
jgi:hypothetical protein